MFKVYVKKQYANKPTVWAQFKELSDAKEWKRQQQHTFGSFACIWIAKSASAEVLG